MFHHRQGDFASQENAKLKEEWYASRTLLDVFTDDPKDILAFIAACSAADLYQFDKIHGLPVEVDLFRSILMHPKCDRATALNILSACQPHHFDKLISSGKDLRQLEDEEDQVLWEILMVAYKLLTNRPTWRGRYKVKTSNCRK